MNSAVPEGWSKNTINECCEILDAQRVPLNSEERAKRKGVKVEYGTKNTANDAHESKHWDVVILVRTSISRGNREFDHSGLHHVPECRNTQESDQVRVPSAYSH